MYKLYERVPKSTEYEHGSRMIDDDENPFKKGPCLLCVSAMLNIPPNIMGQPDRSIFGLSKQGMKMARLRTTGSVNGGFELKDFPVKFLAIRTDGKKTAEIDETTELVDKYFLPLISENDKKIDCIQAMKNMRNVNLLSYCNGTILAKEIENILINKMNDLGYKEEEIKKIQSQMCIFPSATERLKKNQKWTCISVTNVNDSEIFVPYNEELEKMDKLVRESKSKAILAKHSDNQYEYLFEGSESHTIREYSSDGEFPISVCVSSVISEALENSIENSRNEKFKPITVEQLISRIPQIMHKFMAGVKEKELMAQLDKSLTYGGARRTVPDYTNTRREDERIIE